MGSFADSAKVSRSGHHFDAPGSTIAAATPTSHKSRQSAETSWHGKVVEKNGQKFVIGAGEAAGHGWAKTPADYLASAASRAGGRESMTGGHDSFCVSCVELFFYVSAYTPRGVHIQNLQPSKIYEYKIYSNL